jgi:superfamily II DNA or RNA helicase
MIEISKIDDVHLRINAEQHILKELWEQFSFDVPNAKWDARYKNRIWDGKKHLLDLRNQTIYAGLRYRIEDWAQSKGYVIEYDTTGADVEEAISEQDVANYVENLNLHSGGTPLDIRYYQFPIILECYRRRRKLVLSPTASGKSLAIYLLTRWYIDKGLKGLLVVPTTNLVDQMYSDFEDYSSHNGWPVSYHCSKLYSGLSRTLTSQSLLITTWQSIVNSPKEFFNQFDFIIGDEAQNFQAKSLVTIMSNLTDCPYKFGFSGSLSGAPVHEYVIEGLFGSTMQAATTAELIEKGYLAVPNINCMVMKYDTETCKASRNFTYHEEIDFIVSHVGRNRFIAKLASSFPGNTLVLFQRIEKHGHLLRDIFEEYAPNRVYYIDGKSDSDARDNVRKLMESNNNIIGLASRGIFSVGTNIKNLHNGIVAHPTKSRIITLQSLGRGLRKGNNKDQINWYDFSDDLRYKSHINHTLTHFIERIKIYNEEKLPYKVYRIELEKKRIDV